MGNLPARTKFHITFSTGDDFWAYFFSGWGVQPGLWYRGVLCFEKFSIDIQNRF